MGVGVNVHRWDGAVADALLQIRPPVIVASDPDWDVLARCRAEFGCAVVYRHILPDNPDGHGVDPGAFAAAVLAATTHVRHLLDAVQGYNECITSGNVVEQAARELAFTRAVQAQGVPVVALNAAVGQIEPEHIPLLLDLWREAAAIGYHGYIGPQETSVFADDSPWYLRRPVRLWLPVLKGHGLGLGKLLLTETGTYYAPFSGLMGPGDYARLLCDLQEYARSVGLLGTAAFTLSGWEPWQTQQPWELVGTDAVGVLADYNRRHTSAPPVFPIPNHSPARDAAPAPVARQEEAVMPEFKFGFAAKAQELGAAIVGKPLADEEYLGTDFSYQFTEKGVLVYSKKANHVHFLPAR